MPHTKIIVGDARTALSGIPDESVHCCVTSPPYWSLRDYGHRDQIGLEPTPEAYVESLLLVADEVGRVLRDDGTFWLNLGDCYATDAKGPRGIDKSTLSAPHYQTAASPPKQQKGWRLSMWALKKKDLVGMPWRVALALQAQGWYLRAEIVWHKLNPMPESVRDRPARSHEKLFLLSKRPTYFYDDVAVREPSADLTGRGAGSMCRPDHAGTASPNRQTQKRTDRAEVNYSGETRTLRDVWTVSSKPFPGAHFAVMNDEIAERCILAGTSERGVCPACGAPWTRQIERTQMETTPKRLGAASAGAQSGGLDCSGSTMLAPATVETLGWAPGCRCDAGEPVSAMVLDPFGGAGTTALVAARNGRDAVICEINPDYAQIARGRLAEHDAFTMRLPL